MLNKSISLSGQMNELTLKEKLIFTWSIPHLDDYGLLDVSLAVIKATVIPMVKEIGLSDIRRFIDKGVAIGLLQEHKDCLEFLGFNNHQSISEEKKVKSKFAKIPQENSGENNNPQKSPLQDKRSKEKIREEKGREGSCASLREATPKEQAVEFFKKPEIIFSFLEEKGINNEIARREIRKFVGYWTEKNASGTKERWQMQKTFEVKRRLITWFSNMEKFGRRSRIAKIS